MSRGKRYNQENPKLNLKKVVAVIIVFAVIVMVIVSIIKLINPNTKTQEKTVANQYFAVYTNEKWGVINSKGEIIIKPTYDETIIIPDNSKDIFLCTYEVDYTQNTYKTKVLNSKGEESITGYDTIKALENYDTENNLWFENDVLLVSKQGKYGLIDFKGKELLKCEYDEIQTLKGVKNSFLTKKDDKIGLVDNIGIILIENEYEKIEPISDKYSNSYIVTDKNKKVGVINRDKTIALELKYEEIKAIYEENKYVVKQDGKWQIIDSEGKIYLKDKFDNIIDIQGNNVIIEKDKKYGVVTLSGESKIELKYQNINYAFEDNYIFKEKNKFGIININGDIKLKPEYDTIIYREEAGFFEGNKLNAVDTDFIGNDFKVKVSGILSEINIESGYMKIRTEGEYKYYNFKFESKTNKEILTTNTLFLDKKDGKYGYVNKEGIVIVDYIYNDAKEQNEFGYCSVNKNGLWGCIDAKGQEVITPAYELENNLLIEFINKWHRGEDLNLKYYTDK